MKDVVSLNWWYVSEFTKFFMKIITQLKWVEVVFYSFNQRHATGFEQVVFYAFFV